ncbi:MAG TPA: hypothetical protein VHB20_09825 [Verrucomicrobiae bacterium]|jgi:hypothetical protein|nr:hypothetical protein [Verrucomicrobiae bacterium]
MNVTEFLEFVSSDFGPDVADKVRPNLNAAAPEFYGHAMGVLDTVLNEYGSEFEGHCTTSTSDVDKVI